MKSQISQYVGKHYRLSLCLLYRISSHWLAFQTAERDMFFENSFILNRQMPHRLGLHLDYRWWHAVPNRNHTSLSLPNGPLRSVSASTKPLACEGAPVKTNHRYGKGPTIPNVHNKYSSCPHDASRRHVGANFNTQSPAKRSGFTATVNGLGVKPEDQHCGQWRKNPIDLPNRSSDARRPWPGLCRWLHCPDGETCYSAERCIE